MALSVSLPHTIASAEAALQVALLGSSKTSLLRHVLGKLGSVEILRVILHYGMTSLEHMIV